MKTNKFTKYEGLQAKSLLWLSVSTYNNNFYNGFDNDLLLGVSDDDNTTEWYLLIGFEFIRFGYSFTSELDIIQIGILS